ncbi:MAG TPA: TatD family hydrolase [bacterium]|nr:TatD family hydrolase [bacterium]
MSHFAFIDTHSHLTYPPLSDNPEAVIQRAVQQQVETILTIGTDIADNERVLSLAEKFPSVWAAVGLHPNDTHALDATQWEFFEEQVQHERVVAIGECGLDYLKGPADHELQKQICIKQIKTAQKHDLPLIIHTRESMEDMLKILTNCQPVRGVLHCFSGTVEQAHQAITLGFLIGFNGIVTFPNAKDIQKVAQEIPLSSILLETDCPYLAPQPVRGKTNEPQYIPMIADHIARLKRITRDEVAEQTSINAKNLFKLIIRN